MGVMLNVDFIMGVVLDVAGMNVVVALMRLIIVIVLILIVIIKLQQKAANHLKSVIGLKIFNGGIVPTIIIH